MQQMKNESMSTEIDDAKRRALVLALLQRSPYRKGLRRVQDRIAEVALANNQVRKALDGIIADADYSASGRVDGRRHRAALATIRHLFEWIFFASDTFVERARRG
jgi:hypothetical protein